MHRKFYLQVFKITILILLSLNYFNAHANFTLKKNDNNILTLEKTLENNQRIYWRYPGVDAYPTQINILSSDNIKTVDIKWSNFELAKKNDILTAYFPKNIVIPINILQDDTNKKSKIKLEIQYAICTDNGCLPKNEIFEESVDRTSNIGYSSQLKIISSKFDLSKNNIEIILETNDLNNQDHKFLIIDENSNIFNPSIEKINHEHLKLNYKFSKIINHENLKLISNNTNIIYNLVFETKDIIQSPIIIYILLAFIGGAILNLMPCVLPVLSIKLYSIFNGKNNNAKRKESLISLFTIIFYFCLLAIITIFSRNTGKYFIPGFSLQIPEVILLCIGIITIMLSIIREKIYINISTDFVDKYANCSNTLKTITTTLCSTILATPCTAPFLITSMTFAMTQNEFVIISIFFASSIGFGLPYLLIAIFPNLIFKLPKSGKWQLYLKYIFIFMLISTIGWLVFVTYMQLGIYAAISSIFLLYLLRFAIEKNISNFSIKIGIVITIFMLLIYVPVNIGNNFNALDNHFKSSWVNFNKIKLEKYIKNKNLVMVYVTADWCITCKYNKIIVLDCINTLRFLKQNDIILMKADITLKNYEAENYMKINNFAGIPMAIIYGPSKPKGIVLPVMFNLNDIKNAIKLVNAKH